MSWWVSLNDDDGAVTVERFQEGGTYAIGGQTEAELDITYNYSKFYYEHLDGKEGLNWLNNKQGGECIGALDGAVSILGVYPDVDYWNPTPGNAGYALSILLAWARQYPQAKFEIH